MNKVLFICSLIAVFSVNVSVVADIDEFLSQSRAGMRADSAPTRPQRKFASSPIRIARG
jgi:hypothetical protein